MENALKKFPGGLPTLEQIRESNKGSDLPLETAWIWGPDDEIGRINLLTPERVREAKTKELLDGDVVSLNWPLNLPKKPSFGRQAAKLTLKQTTPDTEMSQDDLIDMNTQSGSQWDGFRHVGHLKNKFFYNGLQPSDLRTDTRCGIQAISNHGIVGRGVLLDYYSWKKQRGEEYDPFTSHEIHLDELLQVARQQRVTFEPGDILIIRSGYISKYHEIERRNPAKLEELGSASPRLAGVAPTEEIKTWLHDSYFSAVAGDAPAWETWPPAKDFLHQYLLALWGMPIGEMFDLEALAEQCKRKKRWSFFFMSTPLNIPGGVSSLANALAVQ
ncbi:putative cyclase-domain-containing protein [Emericellopsis atlantica]|uniref:Cyclase-domain-containing protein n=1 Tax=Emericellopsis atlantica TaxID=2614577 RepID=A0A9P8CPZ9_9HYPO|nr:putative cyclase-domain-containing protein [Emericellopsis atlantica]KAG9254757.1 putative cyclase-domain-containing protein [Emericellopsis atlantica]